MPNTPEPDRLALLEGYLHSDPDNEGLRAEVFETAMRVGDWARAEAHLGSALARNDNSWGWRLREAHLRMARRQWPEAQVLLSALRADPLAPAALVEAAVFDAAQVALRQGDIAAGLALLRPLLRTAVDAGASLAPAQQTLWLRLLHRARELDQAVGWADGLWRMGRLAPAAAGVASLAALDHGDLGASRRWADTALQEPGVHMEALVARASVALAEEQTDAAIRWLQTALQHNPADGRARSALGYAELQAGRLDSARSHFELAASQMPTHIGTWHGLGWTCTLQRDLLAARVAFETALELDRNFAESHGALAVLQAQNRDAAAARSSIERALRLDRTCLSAHYAQALLDGSAQDVPRLRQLASRLLAAKLGPPSSSPD